MPCHVLPFAGSHWHWKDDRIFIAGLAEAARRRGLAHGKLGITLNQLDAQRSLCTISPMIASLVRRPGKKVSGALKHAA